MFELNIFDFSYNLHVFSFANSKWWYQLLYTIAIHTMNALVFSHRLLKAVLQLTQTVVFKQLRLHNYFVTASFWTPEHWIYSEIDTFKHIIY